MTKIKHLIEKYQCPGCMLGCDTKCGSFKQTDEPGAGQGCGAHVLGTTLGGLGRIALGLPKGFNREGPVHGSLGIRVFDLEPPLYDRCNVPVWAMAHEGDVLVRSYCPRTNRAFVDVIGGGRGAGGLPPGAIDVGAFHKEID